MAWRITTYTHFPLPKKVLNESALTLREDMAALLQMLCYTWPRQTFQGIQKNQTVFHLVWSYKFIHNFNHIKKKRIFTSYFCNLPAGLILFPSETTISRSLKHLEITRQMSLLTKGSDSSMLCVSSKCLICSSDWYQAASSSELSGIRSCRLSDTSIHSWSAHALHIAELSIQCISWATKAL